MIVDLILIQDLVYDLRFFDLAVAKRIQSEFLQTGFLSVLSGQCDIQQILIFFNGTGLAFCSAVVDFDPSCTLLERVVEEFDLLIQFDDPLI